MNYILLTEIGLNIETYTFVVSSISALAWIVYVFYTNLTFKEIKKQTDLQSRSYLIVNTQIKNLNDVYKDKLHHSNISLHTKWTDLLSNNFPQAVREPDVLILVMKNRGKSDIKNWIITINGCISPGTYLENKLNTSKEYFNFRVKSTTNQQIPPNGELKLAIIPLGAFPLVQLGWNITYSDILTDKEYCTKSTELEFKHNNLLVFNAL